MASEGFKFAIDRGGTFTDVWAKCPDGQVVVKKLLSEDPSNYDDAPREGIRRILNEFSGKSVNRNEAIDLKQISWIRMGTTVATNALLERHGERMALVITQGFKDLLYIGNQARPNIFDLEIVRADVLYEQVVEAVERVVLRQEECCLRKDVPTKVGSTGEIVEIWTPLDLESLRRELEIIYSKGIRSLAVALMHSYTFSEHEEAVGRLAQEIGFSCVSLSSKAMPMVRIVPRGLTACADAYLTPHVQRYINGFSSGFSDPTLKESKVLFMQSDGGLTPVNRFNGARAILSGPAGGVVGYAMTTFNQLGNKPVIGFDMGGTSTDVSRYAGHYEHVLETTTAGVSIQAPQMDINTVAAGGGSRLFFRSGMFVVGPESAGAHPGPVCYRKNGLLSVTDANLVLGRILPEYFPKIFGKTEDLPLDKDASILSFEKLALELNEFRQSQSENNKPLSIQEIAMGFVTIANEAMCRPIRALTQAKGYDTAQHVLAVFGGAGGQHACSIARSLGMSTVYIHKYGGILSAYGIALADVVHETQVPCALAYTSENYAELSNIIDKLQSESVEELKNQGFDSSKIETEPFLNLRYEKTDCALMCSVGRFSADGRRVSAQKTTAEGCRHGHFMQEFITRYQTEFGFTLKDRSVVVDDIRVRAVGKSEALEEKKFRRCTDQPQAEKVVQCYFENGLRETAVYLLNKLTFGHEVQGPAIIIDKNSTIVLEPDCLAQVTETADVKITVGSGSKRILGTELDSIQLSIFSHRFMSTAEQMGRVLQRTSISTNIKERLDFSCAMFGPDGGLVANAPHIPVHLGAMQETVQYQLRSVGDQLQDGDVLLSNHPKAGGSHLPDLTVITPVFYPGVEKPVFFVASRGHHADIGGATPGSMPPHSRSINEEGAVFKSFFLVKQGHFREKEVREALNAPARFPGCSGTRNMSDNLSDLRAQVAANHKGITLIRSLIEEYGLNVVQAYMDHIQKNAEVAVRNLLREVGQKQLDKTGTTRLCAADYMDDGARISLQVDIDIDSGKAIFDFGGSSCEVYGNCNAPRAISMSALIYCLRCMVGYDVPLNQGCLVPVTVKLPVGSILDPSDIAAVVGGNVLTSQRIVDVVFRAFEACAASQGCMNNITFGDENVGYYETVAGGAGAGPGWHGRSGVHTHMTNTRITDPEILERRYPVVLEHFSLRPGSGGSGHFQGGDGVRRDLLMRKPLTLSVLTERRSMQPYGLNGGEAGSRGINRVQRADGKLISVGGKCGLLLEPGDRFLLLTPGGGGYGSPSTESTNGLPASKRRRADDTTIERGSVAEYRRTQESA